MGNRKLRKQLSHELKARGIGKLYHGNKREAWRHYRASTIRHLLRLMEIKVGDIVNDCDGFNHRVNSLVEFYQTKAYTFHSTVIISGDQFGFEDGRLSCGCPYGPDGPWSVDKIESFMRRHCSLERIAEDKKNGWQTESSQKMYEALSSGQRICDDLGIKLPSFS